MTICLGTNTYVIEFRHLTRLGKRPLLGRLCPVKAVTTCVIVVQGPQAELLFTAIDNAICSESDNFARVKGRWLAFHRTVERCGALRKERLDLIAEYLKQTGERILAREPKRVLSPDQINTLKFSVEAAAKRRERQLSRLAIGVARP